MIPVAEDSVSAGRVLIVLPQPFFEDRGTPISIRMVARALTELGYRVDLLSFPMGAAVEMPGLRIMRIPNPFGIRSVPIGFSWRKLLLDIVMAWSLHGKLRRGSYDCVHAVEEAAYLAVLTGVRGVPLVYDMASSIPEQLVSAPLFAGSFQQQLLRKLEAATLNAASFVLCSSGLEGYVRSAQALARVEAWQYPAPSRQVSEKDRARLRRALEIPDEAPVVVYAGSFAKYQGLEVLVDAIPRLQAKLPDLHFLLVGGTTAEVAAMQTRLDPESARRTRILERQPSHVIGAYLHCADVLVSTRGSGANLPIKVFDYLMTGKPVLVSDGPAHRPVMHHDRVIAFENSSQGLAGTILDVLADWNPCHPSSPQGAMEVEREEQWRNFRAQLARVYRKVRNGRMRPK